jgi:hypothetical protein
MSGSELHMLGSLVAVAVAGVAEALVAVAAGEGPAAGVHDGVLQHVGLGLAHVTAVPALTRKGRRDFTFRLVTTSVTDPDPQLLGLKDPDKKIVF